MPKGENRTINASQMEQRIFDATQEVMAAVGVHGVSIQKIAKAAGISVGTIYLYFKNKEVLLQELAVHIFDRFHQVMSENYQPSAGLFSQYETMWWNVWRFLQDNPIVIVNLNQYLSLPNMTQICQERSSVWQDFCQKGIDEDLLVNFTAGLLWDMSMESVLSISKDSHRMRVSPTDAELAQVVCRSFNAICNVNS